MYCVKCGVELVDGSKQCPLCETPVYFPEAKDAPLSYPEFRAEKERVNPRGIYFILSFVFAISAVISFICDINVGNNIFWADFVICGLALAYIIIILPAWFRHPSPVVFVPCDFAAAALYVFYLNLRLDGDWFFTFALPVIALLALIVCSVVILSYYLRRGYLYIWGGASIAVGLLTVVVELLINVNFGFQNRLIWSAYPCATFSLIGIMLIIIAIVKPFRESLCKMFAI